MPTPSTSEHSRKHQIFNDTSSSNKLGLSCLSGQPKPQNMPVVLGEHQFIMLENFETVYISTNQTVSFMCLSFIAGSAILCHLMPNNRSLWGLSLIPSIPPQKLLCRLKLALYTRYNVHLSCFRIETSVKASYPKGTHFIVVARVSMFMQDDGILQNFCWMAEANWPFTTS